MGDDDPEALKGNGEALKCAIGTLNGDGEVSKSHPNYVL